MRAADAATLADIEDLVEDIRQGRMIILMDDEGRENEGDLVVAADHASPEAINFMARFGRGLICLAMEKARVDRLGLPLMAQSNRSRHETAFTVSIEARDGVTTGISAADRARTIKVAIDPAHGRDDIVSPGHVFPLVARDGGVLVRAGHTEAAVDLARMAGLKPAGVICEIMNDDGTMARMPDLVGFAQFHGLKIGTIHDLIAYRRRREQLIERLSEQPFDSEVGGAFTLVVYGSKVSGLEHLALVKGPIDPARPTLVRMHALNLLNDVLADRRGMQSGGLGDALRVIGQEGGVLVLLRDPSPTSVSEQLRRASGEATEGGQELRHYGIGAQILTDLGVRDMILLTNHARTPVGLDGYGLSIVGRRAIPRGER